MPGWGEATFGDPCRECGWSWQADFDEARAVLASTPQRYRARCATRSGAERHLDLSWSVGEYVCHVADNFAIFAERLVGIVRSGRSEVAPYDENELAAARHYRSIALEGALWSLEVRAPLLLEALDLAESRDAVMLHPVRGPQQPVDVARSVAHDAFHHDWDIARTLELC